MTKRVRFATYGDANYARCRQRLATDAARCRWFDATTAYSPEMLSPPFAKEFGDVLRQPRGGGYWIWKWDVIRQELDKMNDGDILVYLDAGCTLNTRAKRRFDEYLALLRRSRAGVLSFQLPCIERRYTTKQLLEHMGVAKADPAAVTGQLVGGVLVMEKGPALQRQLDRCMAVLRHDHRLVTDHFSAHGQPAEFISHRHDQSIFSLVRKLSGNLCVLPDESFVVPFGSRASQRCPFWATRTSG